MEHGTCAEQGFNVPVVTSIEAMLYLRGACCARAGDTL